MVNYMVQVVQQDDFPMLTKIRMPELASFQIIFTGSWMERTRGFIQQGTDFKYKGSASSLAMSFRVVIQSDLSSLQCFQLGHIAMAESYLQSEKTLVHLLDSCHSEIISL